MSRWSLLKLQKLVPSRLSPAEGDHSRATEIPGGVRQDCNSAAPGQTQVLELASILN